MPDRRRFGPIRLFMQRTGGHDDLQRWMIDDRYAAWHQCRARRCREAELAERRCSVIAREELFLEAKFGEESTSSNSARGAGFRPYSAPFSNACWRCFITFMVTCSPDVVRLYLAGRSERQQVGMHSISAA